MNRIGFYFTKTIQTLCGSMSQDVDRATSARIVLEKHLEQLDAELAFLQRVHKEVMHVYLSVYSILCM